MGKIHYIAMAGLHGYLPQFCCSCETHEDAIDTLVDLHELSKLARRQLALNDYLEMNLHRQGNEYCEITECHCDNPEQHNDL